MGAFRILRRYNQGLKCTYLQLNINLTVKRARTILRANCPDGSLAKPFCPCGYSGESVWAVLYCSYVIALSSGAICFMPTAVVSPCVLADDVSSAVRKGVLLRA